MQTAIRSFFRIRSYWFSAFVNFLQIDFRNLLRILFLRNCFYLSSDSPHIEKAPALRQRTQYYLYFNKLQTESQDQEIRPLCRRQTLKGPDSVTGIVFRTVKGRLSPCFNPKNPYLLPDYLRIFRYSFFLQQLFVCWHFFCRHFKLRPFMKPCKRFCSNTFYGQLTGFYRNLPQRTTVIKCCRTDLFNIFSNRYCL